MKKYKNLVFLMQIGINMCLPILVGVFLGNWLDGYFGTTPVLLIICIVVFTLASFLGLYRTVITASKADDDKRK